MLGRNWLSKLGVGVLVLGLAFFLAWQLKEVGPFGKVVTGVVVSAILLGLGMSQPSGWSKRSYSSLSACSHVNDSFAVWER